MSVLRPPIQIIKSPLSFHKHKLQIVDKSQKKHLVFWAALRFKLYCGIILVTPPLWRDLTNVLASDENWLILIFLSTYLFIESNYL
jgi:hypothetical protein